MESAKSSQNRTILEHIKANERGISSKETFERYGITRLSARIWDLRHDKIHPVVITNKRVNYKDKMGRARRYDLYQYVGEAV